MPKNQNTHTLRIQTLHMTRTNRLGYPLSAFVGGRDGLFIAMLDEVLDELGVVA